MQINNMTITEKNLFLATAYLKMNGKGRDVLDKAIQKLAEIQWLPKGIIYKKGVVME